MHGIAQLGMASSSAEQGKSPQGASVMTGSSLVVVVDGQGVGKGLLEPTHWHMATAEYTTGIALSKPPQPSMTQLTAAP